MQRPDLYITALRPQKFLESLGVSMIEGLTADIRLPKQASVGGAEWIADNSAITEKDQTFNSVTLTPHYITTREAYSLALLRQATPSAEQILINSINMDLMDGINKAFLVGTGTGAEPQGLLPLITDGIDGENTFSYSLFLEAVEKIQTANVMGQVKIICNPALISKGRNTLRFEVNGSLPISTMSDVADLQAFTTTHVPTYNRTIESTATEQNQALLGVFENAYVGKWGSVDILVNPYSEAYYSKGSVSVRAIGAVDFTIRHIEAFTKINNLSVGS